MPAKKVPAPAPIVSKKTAAPAEKKAEKKGEKKAPKKAESVAALFVKRPRIFGIGGNVHPPRDASRFMKWPKYIRLQRQKKVMYQRLTTPAQINQFTMTADKHTGEY